MACPRTSTNTDRATQLEADAESGGHGCSTLQVPLEHEDSSQPLDTGANVKGETWESLEASSVQRAGLSATSPPLRFFLGWFQNHGGECSVVGPRFQWLEQH